MKNMNKPKLLQHSFKQNYQEIGSAKTQEFVPNCDLMGS